MFTWISKLAPALLLAGCVGMGLGGGTNSVTLTSDAVTITGPRGFCIEPEETRDDGLTGFVVLGNCASISGSRFARQPAALAVLTAAISEPGAPDGIAASLSTLPEFFASPDGQRVLSRNGDPDTVEILQNFVLGDVFFLRASDSSPGVVPGVQDTYWRAYFDLGPRIVTLSVLALDNEATDEAAQLGLLEEFVAATRMANPPADPDAAPAEVPRSGLFNSGLFRRILGTGESTG